MDKFVSINKSSERSHIKSIGLLKSKIRLSLSRDLLRPSTYVGLSAKEEVVRLRYH
jgi:hypothetical protein